MCKHYKFALDLNLIHRPCVFHWTTIEERGGEGGEGRGIPKYLLIPL